MASRGKPPLVEVEWDDATSVTEQMPLSDVPDRCTLDRRFSVGYLVKKTRESITVAQTFDPPAQEHEVDSGADFLTIPRGWVKSMVTLAPSADAPEKEET